MNVLHRVLAVMALALASFVLIPAAQSTSGPLVITSNTTLAEDHYGSIVIAADNVTLDCAHHQVIGPGPGSGPEARGILIQSQTGVAVENCVLSGFDRGIVLLGADSNRIIGNTVTGSGNGFYLWPSSDDNVLRGNTASGNALTGFFVDGSESNALTGNRATDNGQGFGLGSGATDNRFTGNTAVGNNHGFYLANASDNLIQGNEASDCYTCIQVIGGGSGNVLRGNTVTDAIDYGIALGFGATGNVLSGNTASAANAGFMLQGTDVADNTLTGNIARDNTGFGFLLADGTHDNALTGNTSTSNGDGNTIEYHGQGFAIYGPDNTLTGNTATHNEVWGFILSGETASGNVLRSNVSNKNYDGFLVWEGASENLLDGNVANNNSNSGFPALGAINNTWIHNTANSNGFYGFVLGIGGGWFCSGNLLDQNTARGNAPLDAFDLNLPGLNTWTNNNFGTASGI